MFTIAVIVGSLRKDSINKKLARAVSALGGDLFKFSFVPIDDIPPYNQDNEMAPPAAVTALKEAVAGADAVLLVTPEYNRSIPGVLKNVLDWGSRPYGKNSWSGKPAMIMGASIGAVGTAVAQGHLRSVISFLRMPIIPHPEVYIAFKPDVYADDGTITDESTRAFLRGILQEADAWLKKHAAK